MPLIITTVSQLEFRIPRRSSMKDEAKKEEKNNNKRKRRSKHASERRFFDRFDRIWFWIWAIAILIVLLAATLGYVDEYLGEPKKVSNIAVYKKRTIVIGDVHGCLSELKDLLAKVNYSRTEDRVILVGDIVGKGIITLRSPPQSS